MQAKARVRARIEEVAARIADAERARVEGEVDSESPVDEEVIAVFDEARLRHLTIRARPGTPDGVSGRSVPGGRTRGGRRLSAWQIPPPAKTRPRWEPRPSPGSISAPRTPRGDRRCSYPRIVAASEDGEIVPSVVRYGADGVEAVGRAAAESLRDHPDRTVYSFKRFMGRTLEDRRLEASSVSFPVEPGPRGLAVIAAAGRIRTPQEVSADLLRHLRAEASRCWERTFARRSSPSRPTSTTRSGRRLDAPFVGSGASHPQRTHGRRPCVRHRPAGDRRDDRRLRPRRWNLRRDRPRGRPARRTGGEAIFR